MLQQLMQQLMTQQLMYVLQQLMTQAGEAAL
jgi:hypothetical protein